MTHLIRLELKKIHPWRYLLISAAGILCSMFFVFVALHDSSACARTYDEAFRTMQMIFAFLFVIFFSVMNAAVIIGEYNHGTIRLMFTYPLDKKKLIAAKLVLITAFIALSILAGYLICGLFILDLGREPGLFAGPFTPEVITGQLSAALMSTVVFCCLGLLTFAVGMIKKSVSATIVSAMFFIFLRQLVIASMPEPKENLMIVLAAVCITAAALLRTFARNVTGLD